MHVETAEPVGHHPKDAAQACRHRRSVAATDDSRTGTRLDTALSTRRGTTTGTTKHSAAASR